MCLITQSGKMKAERDLPTFKAVVATDDNSGWCGVFHRKTKFRFGVELVDTGFKDTKPNSYGGYNIRGGFFHSSFYPERCVDIVSMRMHPAGDGRSYRVCRCVVPAGAEYYTDGIDIASDRIVVEAPVRKDGVYVFGRTPRVLDCAEHVYAVVYTPDDGGSGWISADDFSIRGEFGAVSSFGGFDGEMFYDPESRMTRLEKGYVRLFGIVGWAQHTHESRMPVEIDGVRCSSHVCDAVVPEGAKVISGERLDMFAADRVFVYHQFIERKPL